MELIKCPPTDYEGNDSSMVGTKVLNLGAALTFLWESVSRRSQGLLHRLLGDCTRMIFSFMDSKGKRLNA